MKAGALSFDRQLALDGIVVVTLASFLFLWLAVRADFIGNISDAAIYLALADNYSLYREPTHDLFVNLLKQYQFPPLFPLVLGLLGGGSDAPTASYVANVLILALSVGAFYVWLRAAALSRAEAFALVVILTLLPSTLLMSMGIQSEPLYLLLVLCALILIERRPQTTWLWFVAALIIGAATLVRSAGITAIAAFVLAWMVRADRPRAWLVPFAALAPPLLWQLFKYLLEFEQGYVGSVMQDSLVATIDFVKAQTRVNTIALGDALVRSFDLYGRRHVQLSTMVLGGLFVLGWGARMRRLEFDALYVLFYLTLIIVWPYPNHMRRFLFVVFPLFLYYGYVAVKIFAVYARSGAIAPFAFPLYCAIVGALFAPSSVTMLRQVAVYGAEFGDLVRSPQWYMYDTPLKAAAALDKMKRVIWAMRGIDEHIPRDGCVSATVPQFIPLYGKRHGEGLPEQSVPDEELFEALRTCPYVFMMSVTQWPPADYPNMYPYHRIKHRLQVIEVTLWEEGVEAGNVLAMLGKVMFADDL